MTQPLPPLASVLPDIAPEVAAIVDRAVAYDREARWPDAMAMRQALSGLLGNAGIVDSRARLPALPIAPGAAGTDGATVAVPDGALTTGRPFSSQSLPMATKPSRAARTAFVGVAALGTLIVAIVLVLAVSRRAHQAPAAPPAIAVSPPPSTPTVTPVPSPTVTPTPPATSTAPSSSVPVSVPSASSSPSAHPSSKPAPLAPRGPAANPFDQRF